MDDSQGHDRKTLGMLKLSFILVPISVAFIRVPTILSQTPVPENTMREVRSLIKTTDDTLRVYGLAQPSSCFKCDIAIVALMDSIRACVGIGERLKTGLILPVERPAELRAYRKNYPAELDLVADVGGRTTSDLKNTDNAFVILSYRGKLWTISVGQNFCGWLRSTSYK